LRVLLAEDNPVNQLLATRLLEKQGHAVVVANNGREALEALRIRSQEPGARTPGFDLVLMDVQMPELGGLEATAAIRARERETGGHVPIIALTAHAMKGDKERCLEAGMDAYVSKPIQARELVEAMEAVLPAPAPNSAVALEPVAEHVVEAVAEPAPGPAESGLVVLDRKALLKFVDGDPELLQELVQVFLRERAGMMTRVETAISAGDAKKVQQAAHALKGALGTFGAREAFEAALKLEIMGRAGNLTGVEEAWTALQRAVARFEPALRELARQESVTGRAPLCGESV